MLALSVLLLAATGDGRDLGYERETSEMEIVGEAKLTLGLTSATVSVGDAVHNGRDMRATAPPCLLFWGS